MTARKGSVTPTGTLGPLGAGHPPPRSASIPGCPTSRCPSLRDLITCRVGFSRSCGAENVVSDGLWQHPCNWSQAREMQVGLERLSKARSVTMYVAVSDGTVSAHRLLG